MKLNCDMGESYGQWQMGNDDAVMPLVDQANIACGFHAGDPLVMQQTVQRAVACGAEIGAHPSYPDRQGFGRRSMQLSSAELSALIQYQISALQGMAAIAGSTVSYVKPHGALYNDMMNDSDIRATLFKAVSEFPADLAIMVLANEQRPILEQEASAAGIRLIFEAFADRQYCTQGALLPRHVSGAVLSHADALRQATQLITQKTVMDVAGSSLAINADSLCVHGDNPEALALLKDIRALVSQCK